MSSSFVTIQVDPGHRSYAPGETLSGRFRWDVLAPDRARSVELSVLWYTEGKGDEDFGVHYFAAHAVAASPGMPSGWRPFSTELPRSPLSYDGPLVKIRWCVRVRVFLDGGKDIVGEKLFRLGNMPSVREQRAVSSASPPAPKPSGSPHDGGEW